MTKSNNHESNGEIRARLEKQLRGNVKDHMQVQGRDGAYLGLVDELDGDFIKLVRNDPMADGQHHWIPMDWVRGADDVNVYLDRSVEEARRDWLSQPPKR